MTELPLLELEGVTKLVPRLRREAAILDRVSLSVMAGEIVGIWGGRRSGRTTLLRVAAGIELPDGGVVKVSGAPLRRRAGSGVDPRIGFAHDRFSPTFGTTVLDHVAVPLLARGLPMFRAHARAADTLRSVGCEALVRVRPADLDPGETVRVAIARAIVGEPAILLVDEPTVGLEATEYHAVLSLLRTVACDGTAVLFTSNETATLAVADRAMSLSSGTLRGDAASELAPVVELRSAGGSGNA